MKLFHLLKKDVLLVWRSKVWTTFELLIPLILIVAPAALLLFLQKGSVDVSVKHNYINKVDLQNEVHICSGKVDNYMADSPLTWNNKNPHVGGKIERDEIIEKYKKFNCVYRSSSVATSVATSVADASYIVEANLSSTIIAPHVREGRPIDEFLYYNYKMNKIMYALIHRMVKHYKDPQSSLKDTTVPDFPLNLYHLPRANEFHQMLMMIIPLAFAICLLFPVLGLTRNVLVEKESVKPYLSTIGLPVWLFFIEHWIFSVAKTSIPITLMSFIWLAAIKNFPVYIMLGVFFYTLNALSFAIFFSTVLPSPKRAIEGMVIIWIFSSISPFAYKGQGGWTWIASLHVNHAFTNYVIAVENKAGGDGLTFFGLFSSNVGSHQCAAIYLGYLIFNTIWMLILAIFMEPLLSGLGNLFLKLFWGRVKKIKSGAQVSSKKDNSKLAVGIATILNCEEKLDDRQKAPADIELGGLVKVYPNGERAVNGLSLRALRGQVSILLGHNGCGKSTTFGMITGVHSPTEGSVVIGGINARANRSQARKLIGYCPQYNPLYDKLTVWEHLKLANALKGCSGANFQQEAMYLLEQIGLTPKKDTLSKNLSGGMKRKLCVCMAMIGGSQVILLDEPTAGMDPAARIDVQKMLMKVKEKRTILLTTHYMDEAEKLGDWVFVMSHGKMAASGSIHFLKQKYGDGMMLTLVFKNKTDLGKCYEIGHKVVKTFAPTAIIKDERGQMMEISMSEDEKSKLPALLQCLEGIMEKNTSSPGFQSLSEDVRTQVKMLDVVTIGVSMASLEQVFIRIGDECDTVIDHKNGETKKSQQRKRFVALLEAKSRPPKTGIMFLFLKIVALLEKRAYYLYRNPMQILFQIIIPLAAMYWIVSTFSEMQQNEALVKGIQYESFDPSTFPVSTVVVQRQNENDDRILNYLNKFGNLLVVKESYSKSPSDLVDKYMGFSKVGFIIKLDSNNDVTMYVDRNYDWVETHRNVMIAINILASAMYLKIEEYELPHISSQIIWAMNTKVVESPSHVDVLMTPVIFAFILSLVIIQPVIFLIEERVCKFSHQQYLTGISPALYWFVIFLWDFAIYTIILLYSMIYFLSLGAMDGYIGELILTLYAFFFCLAPFVYLISTCIASPSKGSFILYGHCIVIFMSMVFATSLQTHEKRFIVQSVLRVLNPSATIVFSLTKMEAVTTNYQMILIFFGMEKLWELDGLGIELMFSLIGCAVFTLLLCICTMKPVRRGCFSVFHRRSRPMNRKQYKGFEVCTAVNEEEQLIQKVDRKTKIVVVDGLIKDFGKFRALNGLSITVGHEECFGMLGANGAGKTTTFDIITGLQYPTGGTATIEGKDITRNIHIGYCPQFDAMLQQISGRQVLRIMARLQGYSNVNQLVEIVLECVGMVEHGYKLIKNCSGGQKRKISVGIALISRAKCIILDEPTAGIDPRARREIWDILHAMREQGKCSIILTSHSMEECEALCTRIGVLRTGEMIALGTSQSLKSQYGNIYMMTLIVHNLTDREAVCKLVQSEMSDAILKTPSSNLTTSLLWELPRKKEDKWSQKYSQVERLAKQAGVKDYMLTQASLEDTFIRLNTSA